MSDNRTKMGTGPVAVPASSAGPAATVIARNPSQPSATPAQDTGTHATSYLAGPPQADPLIGATLAGRYTISKKLGEGGMGAVYLATHQMLDKQVALKILHGEFARKPDLVERFIQEAKAASRIRHENVIDISDFGTTPEGLVFFAMELLKGHDLHEEVARARLNGQLLPWARSKRIFLQICAALSAAHGKGIVHRDLKPENIYLVDFLGEPDFVKLLDFGIAKLTEVDEGGRKLTKTGMLFGTPEYMSPEQARGEQVDHRVDVYAMGCILFQLVTGRVPFEADNFMGVLTMHLTEPPPVIPEDVFDLIGAPRELGGVIERALEKDREQRYASIDELASAVRTVCGDPAPGLTGTMPAQASMVKAPISTTMPAQRGTKSTPVPQTGQHGRVKTQWTGTISVPAQETELVEPPRGSSKLPLVIGAVVLVGGGAAAAYFALGGRSAPPAPPPIADVGSQAAVTPPPVTPDAAVAPPAVVEAKLPPDVTVFFEKSSPPSVQIVDADGKTLCTVPCSVKPKPAREAVTYRAVKKGYLDQEIPIVPDQQFFKEQIVLSPSGDLKTVKPVPGPGSAAVKPPEQPTTKIDPGPTRSPDKPEVKTPPKPVEDDCPELPCIKKAPTPAE